MWSTREDVMKDLACSGLPVVPLDSQYIVTGQRPPPRPLPVDDDDDEELQLRFGQGLFPAPRRPSYGASVKQHKTNPDLAGISQMLQMIKMDDDTEVESNRGQQEAQCEIVISKLNPNVREFVPREARQEKQKPKIDPVNEDKDKNLRVSPPVLEADRQEIEALHKTIHAAKQEASFDQKRAKNVAIAALLKRHTTPNTTSNSAQTLETSSAQGTPKPLVLFPPDYFTKPAPEVIEPEPEIIVQEPEEPNILYTPKNTPKEVSNPDIKQSIDKVQSWLNGRNQEEKPKLTSPFLGPVEFKKKNGTRSPGTSSVSDLTASPKSAPTFKQYQPSSNAEQLRQRVEKQAKEKQLAEEQLRLSKMSLGERLEYQLKQRDAALRAKARLS